MTTGSKPITGAFLPGKTFTVRNQTETKQCNKLCNLYDKQYTTICRGIDREKIILQRKLHELHNDKTRSDTEAMDNTIQAQIEGNRRNGLFLSNGSNRTAIPVRKYYNISLVSSKKDLPVTPVILKARQMLQSKTANSSKYEFSDADFNGRSDKDLTRNDSSQSPKIGYRRRSSTISDQPRNQEKEEVRRRRNTFSGMSSFANSSKDYSFHKITPLASLSNQYLRQEFSKNSSDDSQTFSDTEEQRWGTKVTKVQKMKIKLNLELLNDGKQTENSSAQNLKGSMSVRENVSKENDTKMSSQNGSLSERTSVSIEQKPPRSLESATGKSVDSPTESFQTSCLGEEIDMINYALQNVHTSWDAGEEESKEINAHENPPKRKVSFSENVKINNVGTVDKALNSYEKSSQNEEDKNCKFKSQKKQFGSRRNSAMKLDKVDENTPRSYSQSNRSYSESWKKFRLLNTTVNTLKKQMHEAVSNIKPDQQNRNKENVIEGDDDVFEQTSRNSTFSEENSVDSPRSLSVISSRSESINRNGKTAKKMSFTEKRAFKRRPSQQLLKIFEAHQQNLPMADLMELKAERNNAKFSN